MGFKIVMDDQGAAQLFIETEQRLRDLGPVMAAIAGEVDDRVQGAFEHKRDPVDLSAWPELRPATIADRARKGFSASEMLQRTGILRSSVVTDADDHGVTTSTRGVEYALIHQLGNSSNKIPQRRFAGVSPDDTMEFEDMLRNFVLNG